MRTELLQRDDSSWQPLPFPSQVEGVDSSALAAFLAFHNVFNTFSKLVLRDLSHGGTQPSHMECLRVLALADGLCQRDIADAMHISRSRVTSIVQELEKLGAVRRTRDGADRRFARVFLTDLGRAIDREKGMLRAAHISGVFAGMTEHERLELTRCLEDLERRFRERLQAEESD